MANVNDFVRAEILAYPDMTANRLEVLLFALCVPESGYSWDANGELVNDSQPSPWTPETARSPYLPFLNSDMVTEQSRSFIEENLALTVARCNVIIADIDNIVTLMPEHKWTLPKQSPMALLMTAPANITDDWKNALADIRTIAEKQGWSF